MNKKTFYISLYEENSGNICHFCDYEEENTFTAIGRKFIIHPDCYGAGVFSKDTWMVTDYLTGKAVLRNAMPSVMEAKRAALVRLTSVGKEKVLKVMEDFQIINKLGIVGPIV